MTDVIVGANGHAPDPWPDAPTRPDPWPAPLDEAAYHGVAGEIVRELAPHTEADPVGVLAVLLAGCGNILGPGIHFELSGKRHGLLLYPVLVGVTSFGRKGTAQAAAEAVLQEASSLWFDRRRVSGLQSGEGLIYQVRDAVTKQEPIRDKAKRIVGYQEVIEDAGVDDKRLFVVEEEFGRTIKTMGRDNSILSDVVRLAWDGAPLRSLTRSPYGTSGAHVTIVGHITPVDLVRRLSSADAANGFGNRFLWVCVHQARDLPDEEGFDPGRVRYLGGLLSGVFEDAHERLRPVGRLRRDEGSRALWPRAKYLLERRPPGLVGAITGRAVQQVLRLATLYAALDVSPNIGRTHLEAALAFWRYCEDSALCVFGTSSGDPVVDTIMDAVNERPRSTTEFSNLFNRNVGGLLETLEMLEEDGRLRREEIPTRGRPRVLWHPYRPDEESTK